MVLNVNSILVHPTCCGVHVYFEFNLSQKRVLNKHIYVTVLWQNLKWSLAHVSTNQSTDQSIDKWLNKQVNKSTNKAIIQLVHQSSSSFIHMCNHFASLLYRIPLYYFLY